MTGSFRITKLDFFTMKSHFVMCLLMVVVLFEFGIMSSSVIFLGLNMAWIIALMSIDIFAIQEKNNLDRLYGSVSVRWKEIVQGRYIFVFLCHFISFFVAAIIYFSIAAIRNKPLELQNVLLGYSLSFFIFSVFIGVQIPLLFLVGYTKARVWAMLPYIVVMGLIAAPPVYTFLLSGVSDFSFPSFLNVFIVVDKFIEIIMLKQGVMIVSGIIVGCVVQLVSYKLAIAAYRKRR